MVISLQSKIIRIQKLAICCPFYTLLNTLAEVARNSQRRKYQRIEWHETMAMHEKCASISSNVSCRRQFMYQDARCRRNAAADMVQLATLVYCDWA